MATKNIEIKTTQNVVLSYELAGVMQRVAATILDSLALGFVVGIIGILAQFGGAGNIFNWLLFISFTFYHLLSEFFLNGKSLGKKLVGIRVMRTDGGNLEFSDYFLRWIMRILDITFSAGALGLLMMLGTEHRQRLGDLMAGTVLVKNKQSIHFTLGNILSLHSARLQDTAMFPQVKYIEEKHILFIKNLLNSRSDYSYTAYNRMLQEAGIHFAELLKLTEVPKDSHGFLTRIVNDYILLTR
jgi:uncharacterized RDD family membrane protein YckC